MTNQDNVPKYDLAELSREALEELCVHLLQVDRNREKLDLALGSRFTEIQAVFHEWATRHKNCSETSDGKISRILGGAAPGASAN